jgi:hypothetical protein
MAQVRPTPGWRENTRFHNSLGSSADLARHLILRVLAVAA